MTIASQATHLPSRARRRGAGVVEDAAKLELSERDVRYAMRHDASDLPRVAERLRTELRVEAAPAQAASIVRWMSCAAVAAEVSAGGVIVRARANRVFRLGDLTTLIREWMQAHTVHAVFASCDGVFFAISPPANEPERCSTKASRTERSAR